MTSPHHHPPATQRRDFDILLALIVALIAMRFVTLGWGALLDPSESRYAEIGREMAASGDWVTPRLGPDQPFWGKPPLHAWLTAASCLVFGENQFAVRLPSFLGLGFVLAAAAWLARRWYGAVTARWAALATASMLLVWATAALSLTDMVLAACITGFAVALGVAVDAPTRGKRLGVAYAGFACLGLALLAKGPVALALVVIMAGVWFVLAKDRAMVWRLPWFSGCALAIAIALPWYLAAEARTPGFLRYFLWNEHVLRFLRPEYGDLYGKGHTFPRGTIWGMWLLAAMPWSPLIVAEIIGGLRRARAPSGTWRREPRDALLFAWAVAPLVFFTPAQNIVVTYVLPGMPALGILVGRVLARPNEATAAARLETRRRGWLIGGAVATTLAAVLAVTWSTPRVQPLLSAQVTATLALLALTAPLVVLLAKHRRIGLPLFACALVPLVDVVAHATVFDAYVGRYSARDLVAAVDHDAKLRARPLAFLATSYSGQFYRHGDATTLAGKTEAIRPFLQESDGLVAMRKRDWDSLPAAVTDDLALAQVIGPNVLVETTHHVIRR